MTNAKPLKWRSNSKKNTRFISLDKVLLMVEHTAHGLKLATKYAV